MTRANHTPQGALILETSADQEHAIMTTLGKTRSTSKTVTVDKAALENVMIDLGRALHGLPAGYEQK